MTSRISASLTKLGIPLATEPAAYAGYHGPDSAQHSVHSVSDLLAIDPDHGEWMLDARQIALWPRLRANLPMVAICGCVAAAAVANVATMTVAVNGAVAASARAQLVHVAAMDPGIASGAPHASATRSMSQGSAAAWRAHAGCRADESTFSGSQSSPMCVGYAHKMQRRTPSAPPFCIA